MSVRDDASVLMLAQILAQPRLFWGTSAATAQSWCVAIRVQRDDVPDAQVKAVIALSDRAGLRSPIPENSQPPWDSVLMIAKGRVGTVFKSPPSRAIAFVELGGIAVLVGEIARGENLSRNLLDQLGGSFRSGERRTAASDIAGADQCKHLIFIVLTHCS